MDCADLRVKLYSFIDGELDDLSCEEVQAHLDACKDCMHMAGFEKGVLELVKARCCEKASPEFLNRLRSALDSSS